MKIDFANLKLAYDEHKELYDNAIKDVINSSSFIMGPEVNSLEKKLSNYTGSRFAFTCSNGTDALLLALMALNIKKGDEIITTPFTFISSAETIAFLGAKPVFVDIEEQSYNLDPSKIEEKITKKTRAIMPVSLFGQIANIDEINMIAEKNNLYVIEDAAQSFGATYNQKKSCNVSTIGTTSFFPAKPLGGYGDGGAVFTRDKSLSEDIRAITNHGCKEREEHYLLGTNGRCDSLQAAIINAKLCNFHDEEIRLRQEVGARYTQGLKDHVSVPSTLSGNSHIYAQYTIRSRDRNNLAEALKKKGIPSAVYYRKPLHKQEVFSHFPTSKKSFPVAEKASGQVISLPFHPYLSQEKQNEVISAVLEHEVI